MPAGIVGRVEDQRARSGCEGRAQFVRVKLPVGSVEWNTDRYCVRHNDIGLVRVIERLDKNHLVTWINQTKHSSKDRFGSARRDDNTIYRIDVHIIKAGGMRRDCCSQ